MFNCSLTICNFTKGGSGDEDMTSLLELLHSCALTNLSLRTDILRCLMAALKESHRYVLEHYLPDFNICKESSTRDFIAATLNSHALQLDKINKTYNSFVQVPDSVPQSGWLRLLDVRPRRDGRQPRGSISINLGVCRPTSYILSAPSDLCHVCHGDALRAGECQVLLPGDRAGQLGPGSQDARLLLLRVWPQTSGQTSRTGNA